MNGFVRGFALAPIVIVSAACGLGRNASSGPRERPPDRNLLDRAAIEHFTNAQQAVQTLRSEWMRRRVVDKLYEAPRVVRRRRQGQPSEVPTPGPWVYQDGVKIGGTEVLSGISTMGVASIQYYDGIWASARWGLGHENGVIYVTSRVR